MKTPSEMSEVDRARDQLSDDRFNRLQATLRKPDASPPPRTGDRTVAVPRAHKEVVEFWDNVPL